MRANHNKIKKLAAAKKGTITDKVFFTSNHFRAYLEDLAEIMSRRYARKAPVVRVLFENSDFVACTNDEQISINTRHKLVWSGKSRQERFNRIIGLLLHEVGHMLYTNFELSENCFSYMYDNHSLMIEPDAEFTMQYEDFVSYLDSNPTRIWSIFKIISFIDNSIEDGYVDEMVCARYPGYASKLKSVLNEQLRETDDYSVLKESTKGWHLLANLLLQYSKFGELKADDEDLEDEIFDTVLDAAQYIDEAIACKSSKDRKKNVHNVFMICWDTIKEYLEEEPDEEEATPKSTTMASEPTGYTAPAEDEEPSSSLGTSEDDEDDEDGDEISGTSSEASSDEESSTSSSESSEGSSEDTSSSSTEESKESTTRDKSSLIKSKDTTPSHEPESSSSTASINNIEDDIAEDMAESDYAKEESKKLTAENKDITYSSIHNGISCGIKKSDYDESDKEKYKLMENEIAPISKKMQRSIKAVLKDKAIEEKSTGLIYGRRINTHCLSRTDGKYFEKKKFPTPEPRLAVALLVDESGSMYGQRIASAKKAAVLLHHFCMGLNIPVAVYGHTADEGEDVSIINYTDFEGFSPNDKYRLMRISAKSNNRDGYALNYVAEKLNRFEATKKLLIILSDGYPAAYGYGKEAGIKDLQEVVAKYKKKNINIFGAAIGSDKEAIETIYKDKFMDITKLEDLPYILTRLVKKHFKL